MKGLLVNSILVQFKEVLKIQSPYQNNKPPTPPPPPPRQKRGGLYKCIYIPEFLKRWLQKYCLMLVSLVRFYLFLSLFIYLFFAFFFAPQPPLPPSLPPSLPVLLT